jgi:L-methionine (R)-S-oxide reductase
VPLIAGGKVLGVLDLDSPKPSRFGADDQAGMERLAAIFLKASDAP